MAARQAHVQTIRVGVLIIKPNETDFDRRQLLLHHGANAFTAVKRGIFRGRLAIDFALTAKSKEATALLLSAMLTPHGWPVAEMRVWVEAAVTSFSKISPSGAPKPRKADIDLAALSAAVTVQQEAQCSAPVPSSEGIRCEASILQFYMTFSCITSQ
jgi:hypothetical protein